MALKVRFCGCPTDPLQGCPLEPGHGFPRPEEPDDPGPEQADNAFRKGVVTAVANAAGRDVNPGLRQTFGIADCEIPASAVRVMDHPLPSAGHCWRTARFRASGPKPVIMDVGTRRPTVLPARTSMTGATWTIPIHLDRQVRSDTRSRLGAVAVNSRLILSSGQDRAGSGIVVLFLPLLPRVTPCHPCSPIRRPTVQRAISLPSRRS